MSRLNTAKQGTLLLLTLGLWAFIIYIHWFASREALRLIDTTNLDKLAHVTGGVVLALFGERSFLPRRVTPLILAIAAAALGWEVFEFFFDAETKFFYAAFPDLWLLDSAGDIVAAILGGYGYWVFGMNRREHRRASRESGQP